tara:strand:+ start:10951 stop:11709 length:759 start_codon:yes stop_codon:yes gene_type:complete
LKITFEGQHSAVDAVKGISYDLEKGKTLGIVGESGSGKTVSGMALMGLLPPTAQIEGQVLFNNEDILGSDKKRLQRLRGAEIALIFQNPLAALNPVFSIANQMIETICWHHNVTKKEARKQAIALLDRVKITDPQRRIDDYPHQFSLGMCQRIMIAMTLSMKPALLIADEPTASLDVTTQKEILELMDELKEEYQMSMIFISHDLGVVLERCDEVAVMYLGSIVEQGKPQDIFKNPHDSYTKKLIDAIPKFG